MFAYVNNYFRQLDNERYPPMAIAHAFDAEKSQEPSPPNEA